MFFGALYSISFVLLSSLFFLSRSQDDDNLDIEITKIDAPTLLALNQFAEQCIAVAKKRKLNA
jgi:hypothetical protein